VKLALLLAASAVAATAPAQFGVRTPSTPKIPAGHFLYTGVQIVAPRELCTISVKGKTLTVTIRPDVDIQRVPRAFLPMIVVYHVLPTRPQLGDGEASSLLISHQVKLTSSAGWKVIGKRDHQFVQCDTKDATITQIFPKGQTWKVGVIQKGTPF